MKCEKISFEKNYYVKIALRQSEFILSVQVIEKVYNLIRRKNCNIRE